MPPQTLIQEQPMIAPAFLVDGLGRNYRVILRQAAGLSHEDSLLQPAVRGNCLNWVVGHITQSRNKMLILLDAPTVWTQEQVARYDRESPPVTSGEDAMPFEAILADLSTAHERLTAAVGSLSPEDMSAPAKEVIKDLPPWNVAECLHFLIWHETYHVGQTEYLRQLTGVNDKVI